VTMSIGLLVLDERGELGLLRARKALKRTRRKELAEVLVCSVALYVSETWTLRSDDIKSTRDVDLQKDGTD